MDFTLFSIIEISALVAIAVTVAGGFMSSAAAGRAFEISLAGAFVVSLLLLRPWEGLKLDEMWFLLASILLLLLWVFIGCLLGTAIGLVARWAGKTLWRALNGKAD